MAGLEADTSSYRQLPAVSPFDTVKEIAGVQQQKQQIDQAKMDQANQALGYMVRAMGSLGPNARKEDYAKAAQNAVDQGLVPQQQENIFLQHLQAAPDGASFYKQFMSSAMESQRQLDFHIGTPETQTDQSNTYQGVRKPAIQGGGFVPSTKMAIQPGPTQPTVDTRRTLPTGPNPDYGQPGIVGASGPAGVVPAVPVPTPRPMPVQPVAAPASGPTGPTVQTGHNFSERFDASFPQKIATGLAPGTAGAITAVSEQSGKDFASDLTRAKNLQSDLYPAERALEIVKELGPQGFGPGTEGLNTIKSAIATWLPNVDQKTIDGVSNFEQARKYLTQIARASGATGTNDQLAAAFEANPSVKMNSASIENVLKSVIALRKMQAAQTLMAANQNIPKEQYSEWIAKNQNQFDPRAFGVDYMSDKAKEKLAESLKKDPKAYQKFEKTLQFAHDAELVGK